MSRKPCSTQVGSVVCPCSTGAPGKSWTNRRRRLGVSNSRSSVGRSVVRARAITLRRVAWGGVWRRRCGRSRARVAQQQKTKSPRERANQANFQRWRTAVLVICKILRLKRSRGGGRGQRMGCQVAKLIFARAPGWITAATEPNGQPVPVWVAQGPLDSWRWRARRWVRCWPRVGYGAPYCATRTAGPLRTGSRQITRRAFFLLEC